MVIDYSLPEINIVDINWIYYEQINIDFTNLMKEIIARYDDIAGIGLWMIAHQFWQFNIIYNNSFITNHEQIFLPFGWTGFN